MNWCPHTHTQEVRLFLLLTGDLVTFTARPTQTPPMHAPLYSINGHPPPVVEDGLKEGQTSYFMHVQYE